MKKSRKSEENQKLKPDSMLYCYKAERSDGVNLKLQTSDFRLLTQSSTTCNSELNPNSR